MSLEDAGATLYTQLVRKGVCPACGGKLEPPRLPAAYPATHRVLWTNWRERTCYDCAETFGYYLDED